MACPKMLARRPVSVVASRQGLPKPSAHRVAAPAPRLAGDLLAGAVLLQATLGFAMPLESAAKLPPGLSSSGGNPYGDIMKSRGTGPSAESLYEAGGGACGPGFKLQRTLSVGANCVCVEPDVCDMERAEMTAEERSFGKKPKADPEAPPPENSLTIGGFVFTDERGN